MGLRSRLVLFFVGIPFIPLVIAVTAIHLQAATQLEQRSTTDLQRAGSSAVDAIAAKTQRAADLAEDLRRREAFAAAISQPATAQAWLDRQEQALEERADFVVLSAPDGELLAHLIAGRQDTVEITREVARRIATAVEQEQAFPEAFRVVRQVPPEGQIITGLWFDDELLQEVASPQPESGNGSAFVADGRILAHVGSQPPDVAEVPAPGEVVRGEAGSGPALIGATRLPPDTQGGAEKLLVLWTPRPSAEGLGLSLAGLAVATIAIAGLLGWVLAGGVVAPVRRAADAARAVAGGDLSRRLQPRGGRELEDLANALNAMTVELAGRLNEIERNRDELRRSTSRLGETLSSSLDLDAILSVVVETAMDMVRADGAALLLRHGDVLTTMVDRHAGAPPRLATDQGVIGYVTRTGRSVRLPGVGGPPPAPEEPTARFQLVVPLRTRDRTIGVLLLLRKAGEEFDENDLATIGSFAAQSSAAIENVWLHEETERLSLTNPVTGLWNNRYFEMQCDAELERARRGNERPDTPPRQVSVMAIDVDHFKRVNDEFGHTAGDAALAEVGRRLREATRAPDVITHLHGEEFAVILPDTDYEGALIVAERMREAVAQAPISLPGAAPDGGAVDVGVTCSVGVATFPRHAADRESLYQTADRAMLRAKADGRNRVAGAEDAGVEPA